MIGYLRGKIIDTRNPNSIIIEINGVGYLVMITQNKAEEIKIGENIEMHIYTHVKEDQLKLFGFETFPELDLFEKLITVSGVGPKTAMNIMNISINILIDAFQTENLAVLTKIPGLGKKTAEKLVIDLRSYFEKLEISIGTSQENKTNQTTSSDAIEALIQLGYSHQEALVMLRKAPKDLKPEELVRFVLRGGE